MNEKFLVIGSNSFSGSDFIDLLLQDPTREVMGISRSPEYPSYRLPYKQNRNLGHFRFHQLDLNRDISSILDLIHEFQPHYLVNFAAQGEVGTSWENPLHWYQTNVLSIASLAHGLRKAPFLKKFVQISTPEVYGSCEGAIQETERLSPSTPYAASKAGGDLALIPYLKNFNLPLVIVRATNVYGAHQQLYRIIPRSIILIKKGEPIELHGGGHAVKSYIHIRDVSRGELAIAKNGNIGEIYHLSPDSSISIQEVVRHICKLMHVSFEDATRMVGERLGQDAAYVIDSTKARKQFQWRPEMSWEQGIQDVVQWIDTNWSEIRNASSRYEHQP